MSAAAIKLTDQQSAWLEEHPLFTVERLPAGSGAEWGVLNGGGSYWPYTTAWNGNTGEDSATNELYVYELKP